MKKLLSIFLVICLVLSAVTVTAMGTETAIDFEDVSKWILNSDGENIDGREGAVAKASWASITVNTNTDFIKEGDSSLKVYNNWQFASFKLEGLKPNAEYILTYDHYVPTLYVTKAGVTYNHGIEYTGIFMPDFDGASAKNNKDGWLDSVNTSVGRITPDGIYANGTNDARKTSGITEGEWYTVEHTIYTSDFDNLYLLIKANADVLYLDNFTLTEVIRSDKAENLITNGDFADDSNVDTTTKNYKGTAENFGKWINMNTGVSNFAYSEDGGVNGSGAALATVPATQYLRTFGQALAVKSSTNYIVTFKFKGNIQSSDDGGAIYAGAFSAGGHALPGSKVSNTSYVTLQPSEEWVNYEINFNSGSKTALEVAFGGNTNAQAGLYYLIDDVGLYEADKVSRVDATATEGGTVSGGGYYNRGRTATLTATPFSGYNFEGWYLGENLVSKDLSFSVTANVNGTPLEYLAKFSADPNELLFDGGFDFSDKVSDAENYDTVSYESAHIWYKPSGSSKIETLDGNKVLKLSTFAYQSVKLSVGTSYTLKFRAKNNTEGLKITLYVRNLKNRNDTVVYISGPVMDANDEWTDYSFTFKLGSTNITDFALGLQSSSSVYIDDVSLKANIITAYNNAAALRSAEASSTGKNGLRVYNEIKKEWITTANIVEFGSIAYPTEKLGGAELTYNYKGVVKGVAYSNGQNASYQAPKLWGETDNSYTYTAYLTNVKNYANDISVRAYAIDSDGKFYYGEIINVSIFKIANAIDNGNTVDGSSPSETDKDAFYVFVTDSNYSEYYDWCIENKFTVGTLYNDKYSSQG